MTQIVPLAIAVLIGAGASMQTAMLGAMGRERGPVEATWTSLAATVFGVSLVLLVRSLRGDPPVFQPPLDRTEVYALAAALTGTALVLSLRGIAPYYAITGLFAIAFLFAASELTTRLGIAVFVSAVIVGQLLGAVALDQVGAFGATARAVNLTRAAGVVLLLGGLAMIRGR